MNHQGMQGSQAPSLACLGRLSPIRTLYRPSVARSREGLARWRNILAGMLGAPGCASACDARNAGRAEPHRAHRSRLSSFHRVLPASRRRTENSIVRLDRVASAVLRSARLSVPSFTNKLQWQDGDRWRLAFWYAQGERSDFCMSMRADYVIAKRTLANKRCARDLAHASFADLYDATACLSAWLASTKRASSAATPLSRDPAEP
jgi:hypothetical protein